MKKLKSKLRLYLAEKMLFLAFDLCPNTKQGWELRVHILGYFEQTIFKNI